MKALRFITKISLLPLLCWLGQPAPNYAQSSVSAWGLGASTLTNVPAAITNVVAVSAGGDHVLALRSDRTVVAWGTNTYGQTNIPPALSNVVAIAAGYSHNLALRNDGTIAAWGLNTSGQSSVPPGLSNVIAIASGAYHNVALRVDGTVTAWGSDGYGQTKVPSGLKNVVAIAAGSRFSLALRVDGGVVAWGSSLATNVPASLTNAVGIAAGDWLSLALLADGRITAWPTSVLLGGLTGSAFLTNTPPPELSNVVTIAAGAVHGVASKSDGQVVCWGSYTSVVSRVAVVTPATNVPTGLSNVVAVSAAGNYNLALIGHGPPTITSGSPDITVGYGATVHLRVQATGGFPLGFQWRFNGQDLPEATNAVFTLANVQPVQSGVYSVVVSNAWGTATNSGSFVDVPPILITSQPKEITTFKGATAQFEVGVATRPPVTYQWRFNGIDLPGATNKTLLLTNVQFSQTGGYSLLARNEQAEATSAEAPLNVLSVAAWGSSGSKPTPDLTNVVSLAGGIWFGLALKRNGTVSAWGINSVGDTDVPADLTNATAVSANYYSSVALRSNGTVTAWGNNAHGQREVPVGVSNVVAVAAGYQHSLALTSAGRVIGWGISSAVSNQPLDLENVTAIAAGNGFSLALRGEGSVVSWGDNLLATNVPGNLGEVVAVAAGGSHALALRADGSVFSWGDNFSGQTNVPAGLSNVVAIAAGGSHSLALQADGTLVTWGNTAPAPADLREVTSIAAGYQHSLALVGDGPPFLLQPLLSRTVVYGSKASLFVLASGAFPLTYQWLLDGTNIPGATSAILTIDQVQFSDAARYSVIIGNPFGQIASPEATLKVVPSRITRQPQSTSTFRGDDVGLSVTVDGQGPFVYQWRINGVDLGVETGRSLLLSNVQTFQSGDYSVVVRNAAGSITSSVANVLISEVAVWGDPYFDNFYAFTKVPAGLTNVIAVAASEYRNLALIKEGTVVAWGNGPYGPFDPPAGLSNVIAVAASMTHSLALLANGTVVGWGRNSTPPDDLSNIVAIAAGIDFSIGLKADGTVVAWGSDIYGSTQVPPDLRNVVAIAACSYAGLALKRDGRVAAWGWGYHGQTNVAPFSDIVAIGSGYDYSAALRDNGAVVVWGENQLVRDVPPDLIGVISIACGNNFMSALKSDGTVVLWGNQTDSPARLRNVVALSAGFHQTLALVGDEPPVLNHPLSTPAWNDHIFSVSVPTRCGRVYALEYKTSLSEPVWTSLPLQAGDGSIKMLTDPTANASQRFYHVLAW